MIELFNDDCMNVMARYPDNHFDLAITDPPYGRGEHGGIKRTHAVIQKNGKATFVRDGNYSKKSWDNEPPPIEYFDELKRVSLHQIIWGVNYYDYPLKGGRIVWDKVNDGANQSGAEIAYNSINQRVDIVRYMWRGMMQGLSVYSGSTPQGNKSLNEIRIHPTQKPIKIYEWLLTNYAEPGQKILDTHLGSGSSAIAAHYFGVDFVGCEIDKDYFEAAKKRIDMETRQVDLLQPESKSLSETEDWQRLIDGSL